MPDPWAARAEIRAARDSWAAIAYLTAAELKLGAYAGQYGEPLHLPHKPGAPEWLDGALEDLSAAIGTTALQQAALIKAWHAVRELRAAVKNNARPGPP